MSILKDEEPPLFKTSDFTFTKRKIEEDDDIKKSETVKTSLAMRFTKHLVTSRLFCRVFRVFSIFRLDKFFARRNMPLVRVYFRLIYIFVATIMIFAAAML